MAYAARLVVRNLEMAAEEEVRLVTVDVVLPRADVDAFVEVPLPSAADVTESAPARSCYSAGRYSSSSIGCTVVLV